MDMEEDIKLQVLICTYGRDGIERVNNGLHPKNKGVEYLISWQASEGVEVPDSLQREDFRIYRTNTKGLSKNRNHALSKATAPFLLISDDDVDYTQEGLNAVINSFEKNPDMDILTFKYASISASKNYPEHTFSLKNPDKGYFVTSIEIALRCKNIKGKVWFNEDFGIGAHFPSGEEDVFIKDILELGLTGQYLPITIARHDGTTTSERNPKLPSRPQTNGAVFLHLHPKDWFLRMIVHAIREIPQWRKGKVPSPLSYCLNWMKGVRMAKRMKVFPTPDYSKEYLP